MVEVMEIMATSFKRSHAHTAKLSAPNPGAGHRQPTPPPETPGHSQASLGQSLAGSLLLSPGSWCTRFCLCPPRVCFQSSGFWRLCGGVNGDLLHEGSWHSQVYCTQSPCLCSRPLLTGTSAGDAQTQSGLVSVGSLGPGAHKICLSPPSVSGGMGFDSKCDFAPPTILLGLLLCPWMWRIFFWWDPTFSCGRLLSSEL